MILTQTKGAAPAAPAFDAAAWFAAWSNHGGFVAWNGERLIVGRLAAINKSAAQTLDRLRAHLFTPGAAIALAGVLRGNREAMA